MKCAIYTEKRRGEKGGRRGEKRTENKTRPDPRLNSRGKVEEQGGCRRTLPSGAERAVWD